MYKGIYIYIYIRLIFRFGILQFLFVCLELIFMVNLTYLLVNQSTNDCSQHQQNLQLVFFINNEKLKFYTCLHVCNVQ